MRLVVLRCGTDIAVPPSTQLIDVKAVPTRQELKALDSLAAEVLPEDPTPSLAEIAAQPDVAHLGTPQYAPQPISDPLRVVVVGSDAALSAVLTRLMRADTMWVEVGFVPTDDDSPTADYWGITNLSVEEQFDYAASGRVRPLPLIRDDAATAVAGRASVSDWENRELTAEIIVDDDVLARHQSGRRIPRTGVFGARVQPVVDAPGLAGFVLDTPVMPVRRGLFGRFENEYGSIAEGSRLVGRALQAGGESLRVMVDGVSRKRPVERVTFYRHLRDAQVVRP